jgi:GNAT superfamily N-acetyltransferase
MHTPLEIRRPMADEKSGWLPLWNGYLEFYGCQLAAGVTDTTWHRIVNDVEPIHCLSAYIDARMVGFATYVMHRSTWSLENYCYLEDLFVDPQQRGKGVANRLIQEVTNVAKLERCTRLYWSTRENNAAARAVYDRRNLSVICFYARRHGE